MTTKYGCELVVDLSRLEHLPEVSYYNNNWYKNREVFIFVKCLEDYNQVDIYISDKVDGHKVFLISDHWNDEDIYSGEIGLEWT